MGGISLIVEMALVGLLSATLLYAVRLQRVLTNFRADRAALHEAVEGFDTGTRKAEAAMASLREAADKLGAQLGHAAALRDDLAFLSERGEALADRLDASVRAGRTLEQAPAPPAIPLAVPPDVAIEAMADPAPALAPTPTPTPAPASPARVRSQAERMLLAALKAQQ